MVENRLVGIKSREIYEAPAAVVLHAAHKELQKMVIDPGGPIGSRARVSLQYADLVYNGLWFTPLREALDAFVDKVQERVTGVIRLKLFKGDCRIVGRKSPHALHRHAHARGRRRLRPAAAAGSRRSADRRHSARKSRRSPFPVVSR